jgi:hypothetical protein
MKRKQPVTVFEDRSQRHPHRRHDDSDGFLSPEPPVRPLSPDVFLDAFDFDEDGFLDPDDFAMDRRDMNESAAWWE